MSNILKAQSQVSKFRGLPVDFIGASQTVIDISGETVQLYYYNSGVQTVDNGQAVGTVVVGRLANMRIKNELGAMCATHLDTSLSFTSTALINEVAFPFDIAEGVDDVDAATRANVITSKMANGDYCVDYVNGLIYGKKASTETTLTSVSYKIQKEVVGTSGGVSTDINLNLVGGSPTAVNVGNANAGTQRVVIASNQPAIPTTTSLASSVISGAKTVATAGVAEALGAPTTIRGVTIQANIANTGNVLVGSSSSQDIVLSPGDIISIDVDNLNVVYIDVTVNGEGVNYIATQ